jgi:DNA-binding GntR family transcriptional regulator
VAILNVKSLREQVYEYIRDQMMTGHILPNSTLNLNQISEHLGISKTPLRDALIRLEVEGFVTIMPRRGVVVNALTLQDVKDFYQICGALEGDVVKAVFDRFNGSHIADMRQFNSEMRAAVQRNEFDLMYRLNLRFHDVFLNLSDNQTIRRILMPLKQRLYDFQRRPYLKEWELRNSDEHDRFIDAVKAGQVDRAVHVLRDEHWSFQVQEDYIRTFHQQEAALNGENPGNVL